MVIVDKPNNSPLYPDLQRKLWPVEAIYALIEIKTQLSPRDLQDALKKVRRFKKLQRKFLETQSPQYIKDSLAIIWSFEAPNPETLKANLIKELESVPLAEQPDFVVVPDSLVVQSGGYLELNRFGQENSVHRQTLKAGFGNDSPLVLNEGKNALHAWFVWFDSWLRQAGPRFPNPIDYLP